MKYKAKISFCGTPVSMHIGEEREFPDEVSRNVINDLLQAGLIEKVKQDASAKDNSEPVKIKRTKSAQ